MTESTTPNVLLEKLALGEINEREYRQLRERGFSEEKLDEAAEKLREDNKRILEEYPVHSMATHIRERLYQASRDTKETVWEKLSAFLRHHYLRLLMPAAAALLLVLIIPGLQEKSGISEPGIRLKGERQGLYVYRKQGRSFEQLLSGDKVYANDILQLGYQVSNAKHGVIFSIDGSGQLTLLFPEKKENSTALQAGKRHLLNFSYQLDQAPGFERFFFVTSRKELPVGAILEAGKRLAEAGRSAEGRPEIPDSAELHTVFLQKKKSF